MKIVFAPAVRFLNRLSYPRKFGVIGLLVAIPLSLVSFFLIRELNGRIAFSAKEQLGNEYLRPLQQFAADLRDHRGLTWARGDQQDTAEVLRRVEERLEQDVRAIDEVDLRLQRALGTHQQWVAIRKNWSTLLDNPEVVSPIDPNNQHTALIRNLLALMSHVGDQSNLILDPELDSYYLMDLLVNRLPLLTEQIGQTRAFKAGLAGRQSNTEADQLQQRILARGIALQMETVQHHFRIALRETIDPAWFESLKPSLERSLTATNQFMKLIDDRSEFSETTAPSSDEVWQQSSKALQEYEQLYTQTSAALDRLLKTRVTALSSRRMFVVCLTLLFALLLAYLFVAFYLAVMRTVSQLEAAAIQLIGNTEDEVPLRVDTQDELGQITRSFGLLAARLRTESTALRSSEQRIRGILEGAADAVVTIDDSGLIQSVNSSTERMFGYGSGELNGLNVRVLMPEPFRSEHNDYLRRYLATGDRRVIGSGREVLACRRDGTTFHADLAIGEAQMNNRRIFTGFVRDISDRKRAEQALATVNAQLEGVLDAATQISIISTDVNGLITVFNSGAENLLGYTAEEMIGKNSPRIIHVAEEIEARGLELSRELGHPVEGFEVFVAMARQGRFDRREWTYVRKDGSRFTVSLVVTAVRNSSGEINGFLGVASDITLRKQTERHLLAARDSAEQAARAKGEFLANMSHEIRTPMNGIIGMTDLVLDTDLTSEQHEYLEVVKSSADSLLRIINDILDFSKIEAGRFELDPQPFQLRDSLGDTMKILAVRADHRDLELLWHTAPDVPDCLIGDSGRIRQILVNLCGNAIKFTERGEVSVFVDLVSRTDSHACLRFSVHDTGIGIPQEKHALIFEAFSQADASTTRAYGGTGLGLSISRQLVRSMHGDIKVESEEGKGSIFSFEIELPVAKEQFNARASEIIVDLTDVRVLVVDDNQTNRRILEEMLRGWKMLPTLSDSGHAALEILKSTTVEGVAFDLILTDCQMPHMDGFMFVEELRKHPGLERCTIMMLTSADRQGGFERCRQLGIAATLLKPLKQSELQVAICEILSLSRRFDRRPADNAASTPEVRIEPLRILVAEDNPVNQLVAQRLLKKLGHEVLVVENGQLALDALQSERFDVVLMDMHMPVLDGFRTVAAIREQEKCTGGHQPIVAMTANAMSDDRKRCLEAGMDDYVSKPVNAVSISEAIGRVTAGLTPVSASCIQSQNPAAETGAEPKAFDIDEALAKSDGDVELMNELFDIFLQMVPGIRQSLQNSFDQSDLQATAEVAHLVKGSVSSFGAECLWNAALTLEQICRKEKIEEYAVAHQTLTQELNRLTDALTKYRMK